MTGKELEAIVREARAKVDARAENGEISPEAMQDVENLIELMHAILVIGLHSIPDSVPE